MKTVEVNSIFIERNKFTNLMEKHPELNELVVQQEEGMIYGDVYHLIEQDINVITNGLEKVYGEIITFNDFDRAIEILNNVIISQNEIEIELKNVIVGTDDDNIQSIVFFVPDISEVDAIHV